MVKQRRGNRSCELLGWPSVTRSLSFVTAKITIYYQVFSLQCQVIISWPSAGASLLPTERPHLQVLSLLPHHPLDTHLHQAPDHSKFLQYFFIKNQRLFWNYYESIILKYRVSPGRNQGHIMRSFRDIFFCNFWKWDPCKNCQMNPCCDKFVAR